MRLRGALMAALPLSAVGMAIALGIGFVRSLAESGKPFFTWGDQAVIELQVRLATHFRAELGPYDRFGWHHPGPTYFYLLAPLYVLAGDTSRVLSADQLLLSLVMAVAAVAVVHRRFGWVTGCWAAAATAAVLLAYGPVNLIYPWNPLILPMAVLLTSILAALAAVGSVEALVWAVVVASFAVQTDVSAGLVLAVTMVVAVAGFIRSRRAVGRSGGLSRLAVAGLVVAVLMWIPPAVQTFQHFPGNGWTVVHFFLSSHTGATHTFGEAYRALGSQLSLHQLDSALVFGKRAQLLGSLDVLDAIAVLVVAVRWRRRDVAALGLVSLVGLIAAFVSIARVVGPIYPYLIGWMAVLPIPAWIGTGMLLEQLVRGPALKPVRRGLVSGWVAACAVAVLAAVPTALLGYRFSSGSTVGYTNFTMIGPIVADAESGLRHLGAKDVVVRIAEPSTYTEGAGVVDELVKDHFGVQVDNSWVNVFGQAYQPLPKPEPVLYIVDATDPSAPVPGPAATGVIASPGSPAPLRVWVQPA